MTKSVAGALSILRAALLASAALGLAGSGAALARVGVTSATDGDPLGKPPQENERILRIGIDVQANEVIRTGANDRAHLVFLDGSALTVGPNAQLTIDKFVYDPNTKTGELAINASKGVLRLVGGKISKTNPITITTPSSTIGIRGGICLLDVDSNHTTSTFAFGNSMTVMGQGKTQIVTRPGSQVNTSFGAPPGPPTLAGRGSVGGQMAQLEGRSSGGSSGQGGSQGGNADQGAQKFGQQNSGQGPGGSLQGLGSGSNVGGSGTSNISNAISGANQQNQSNSFTQTGTNPTTTTIQTMSGYSNGVIVARDENDPVAYVPQVKLSQASDVSITTNTSTKQAQGTIIFRSVDTTTTPSQSRAGTFQFGGSSGTSQASDANTYSMSQSTDPNRPSTLVLGSATNTLSTTSALNSSSISNSSTAPGTSVTQNLSSTCNCAYLTWGWWSTTFTSPYDRVDSDPDVQVKITSAPFVVGAITTMVQMPQTGTATYNGFMTGNVWNGSTLSSASGSYSNSWSFQTRSGSFSGSFDSVNYSGTTSATSGSGGVSFTGSISGGARTGSLQGSFFGPQANNQAGSFGISGTNYKAGGIFAGSRR